LVGLRNRIKFSGREFERREWLKNLNSGVKGLAVGPPKVWGGHCPHQKRREKPLHTGGSRKEVPSKRRLTGGGGGNTKKAAL